MKGERAHNGGAMRLHLRSSNSVSESDVEGQYFPNPASNKTLARETEGCSHILFHTSTFIVIDVCRQVAGYGMKYYNVDQFPVEPTEVVAISEIIKVVIFFVKLLVEGGFSSVKLSRLYILPSLLYAINSNIYFAAMHYTTPPFWNILLQLRVIFTAIMYRVVFRRTISPLQWFALTLLMSSIFLSKFSSSHQLIGAEDLSVAISLSIVASLIASLGPLYTEYLFKNDNRTFTDMQFQLYLFGSLSTWGLYFLEFVYSGNSHTHRFVGGKQELAFTMMVVCIGLTAVIGISTAYIMKRLDNMVKLYAESLSSMLMTVACVVLFPKRFTIDAVFIASLLLTLFAIFLYEKDNLKMPGGVLNGCKHTWKSLCHQKARMMVLVVVAVLGFVSVCVVAVNLTVIYKYVSDMKLGVGTAQQTIPPNPAMPHALYHKIRKMPALKQ